MTEIRHVVLVSGWRGSGKSHLCRYVSRDFGAFHIEFADALKDAVAQKYGLERSLLEEKSMLLWPVSIKDDFSRAAVRIILGECRSQDAAAEANTPLQQLLPLYDGYLQDAEGAVHSADGSPMFWTVRALLIYEGSMTRAVRHDYWTSIACQRIEQHFAAHETCRLAVVGGFRYRAEEEAVRQHFEGSLVGVQTLRICRFDDHPENSLDPSERDLDMHGHDCYILNNGSVEHYESTIADYLRGEGLANVCAASKQCE